MKDNSYNPQEIEQKWQKVWSDNKLFSPDMDTAKNPFYNLMMFPYPSAEGMHVGNMYAFTGTDIYGRFMRMKGFDVFEPIGLDGFGIHSENYALKVGAHPMDQAEKSEKNFYRQLHSIGSAYDWTRTVETYDPGYYKWTQWLFIQMFKKGLAYRKKAEVNFCPSCKTVLSDEQVIAGRCERCNSEVERRELEQWFFRITDYADRLLANIEGLDWTEKVKIAQRNWIGKSEGAEVVFHVLDQEAELTVFTTRPDTLYGATFMVVSPEHILIKEALEKGWISDKKTVDEVIRYQDQARKKTTQDRTADDKEKTGVFSGLYAINPVNNEKIPVWIADYVLMSYGTGAIMAVPAHDERDFAFASRYKLPVRPVVQNENKPIASNEVYTGSGTLSNSEEWNGLKVPHDMPKILNYLEKKGIGTRKASYHLRDWLISRQRYWGPPIPMIYCASCAKNGKSWFTSEEANSPSKSSKKESHFSSFMIHDLNQMTGWYPVNDEALPVALPRIEDYKPLGTGASPLATHEEFYKVVCPSCGEQAMRETDVSDVFVDSAWYFLRYTSTDLQNEPFDMDRVSRWLPVDMYVGGAEHSVLHLLYARFVTMFLKDLGLIDFEEPFARFFAHGLLIKEGAKMSKSKGNVVVPDEYITRYGADTLRCYLMFLGPYSHGGDFYDTGIEGMHRFLKRVWKFFTTVEVSGEASDQESRAVHKTIKAVTEDLEGLSYNTAIAHLMELYNVLSDKKTIGRDTARAFLQMLAPFAPHMTDEIYHLKDPQAETSIHISAWPVYNADRVQEEEVIIVVQVNGKVRDNLVFSASEKLTQELVESKARATENVAKYLSEGSIKKVIYVPNKILNFVVAS
jgi:leucyl-tRNA synthetase